MYYLIDTLITAHNDSHGEVYDPTTFMYGPFDTREDALAWADDFFVSMYDDTNWDSFVQGNRNPYTYRQLDLDEDGVEWHTVRVIGLHNAIKHKVYEKYTEGETQ